MAVTLTGVIWNAGRSSRHGPFVFSTGNVYALFERSTFSRVRVCRSTDGGATWNANYAEVGFNTINPVDVVQDGDALYFVSGDGTNGQAQITKWSEAGSFEAIASAGPSLTNTTVAGQRAAWLARRSDGSFVVFYQGPTVSVMGNARRRVYYVTCTSGGSWGTPVEVSGLASNSANDADARGAILGSSDRVHFFYTRSDSANNLHSKTLSAANGLSAESTPTTGTGMHTASYPVGQPVNNNGSITVPVANGTTSLVMVSGSSADAPTWGTTAVEAVAVQATSSNPGAIIWTGVTSGNDQLHAVYTDNATADLFHEQRTPTATWTGTKTEVEDNATVQGVSAGWLTSKLGYLFNDNGTVKYGEVTFGAAAHSLTADPDTYAVTGAAAGTVSARAVTASPASHAVTGQAATFARGFALNADPGVYIAAGADSDLAATRTVTAAPDTYTVAGQAAATVAGRALPADPEALTVTGTDAATVTGRTVDAQPDAYTVTGAEAALIATQPAELAADPATVTVTGAAAAAVADRAAAADPATYLAAVTDAQPVAAHLLNADEGAVTATGAAAATAADRTLTADSGAYTETGSAADLDYVPLAAAYELDCQPATVEVTGAAATPAADRHLTADPDTYTVTGADADLAHQTVGAYTLDAAATAFTVVATAATPVATRHLSTVPAAFTLTGTATAHGVGRAVVAAAGTFTLAGLPATQLSTRIATASSGTLTVTGADVTFSIAGRPPNLPPILTGWLARPVSGPNGVAAAGAGTITTPDTGGIA